MLNKFIKNNVTLFFSFFIPFAFYIKTVCPTLSSYADAGEFPISAYTGGFAHPPGYPLFILILKFFMLFPLGNPAKTANIACSIISAITIAIFYLLAKELTKKKFPSFLGAMVLSFSGFFWKNAIISEAFGLLCLFIVLSLYLYVLWIRKKKNKYFFFFMFFCGLGLSHHQLLVVCLFPLLIHFILNRFYQKFKLKDFFIGILLVLLGFFPYIYIYFIAAPRLPLMNWENPSTINGLWRLITRSSYGTFTLTTDYQSSEIFQQLKGIFLMFINNFTIVPLIFFTLGLFYLFISKKLSLFFYIVFVIFTMVIFCLFSGMPAYQSGQIQYLERFLIIPAVFVSLTCVFAFIFIQKLTSKKKPFRIAVSFILLLVPVSMILFNYNKIDQSKNYYSDKLAEDIFSSIPKNSIFLIEGDSLINTLYYHRYVLGKRRDVSLILGAFLSYQKRWYIDELKKFYPDLIYPEESADPASYLEDFILSNASLRKIYLYIFMLENDLSINIPKINKGIVWEYGDYDKVDKVKLQSEINGLLGKYLNLKGENNFRFGEPEQSLNMLYYQPYFYLARINHEDIKKSEKYYFKIIEINPENYLAMIELGDDYFMSGDINKALIMWKKALFYIDDPEIIKEVENRIKQ